jgi:hypothetical protein
MFATKTDEGALRTSRRETFAKSGPLSWKSATKIGIQLGAAALRQRAGKHITKANWRSTERYAASAEFALSSNPQAV